MRHACVTLLGLAGLAALLAAGCGGEEVPADAVAKVGDTVISKGQYKQRMRVAEGRGEHRRDETMEFLIQREWVRSEADQLHVVVSDAEVRRTFEQQKAQAFTDEASYQRFLQASGGEETEIMLSVRTALLYQRLSKVAVAGLPADEQRRALDEFARALREEYRRQTHCAAGFEVSSCAND